jgi:hypothetical protein
MTTWRRIKVNDRFEFPLQFDLNPFMEERGENLIYQLSGIVLHSGTAEGGHYTSSIRINNKWFSFNDTTVVETTEKAVLEDAYGGIHYSPGSYEEHRPSAYLLFFEPFGNTSNVPFFVPEDRDSVLLQEIAAENQTHAEMQFIFSTAVMTFILDCDDLEVLFLYCFNIFAHSNHASRSHAFVTHLLDVIQSQNAGESAIHLFLNRISDIESLLLQCTQQEICDGFVDLISGLFGQSPIGEGRKFATTFLDDLSVAIHNWRVLPLFLELFLHFVVLICNLFRKMNG